jgi:hypothetical protein
MNEPTKVCSRADCPHGGVPQPLANFYNRRASRDGKFCECKTCIEERKRVWKRANREKHLAGVRRRNKRRYAADPERGRERVDRIRKRVTPEGVQRNTLYVRAYRARKRAAKEHTA